jgi:hypothetical protein
MPEIDVLKRSQENPAAIATLELVPFLRQSEQRLGF